MYISELHLQNFRSFEDRKLRFNDGVNVIIGENNAGKTTILDALQLIFGYHHRRRPDVWDFWRGLDFENLIQQYENDADDSSPPSPPQIRVQATLRASENDSDSAEEQAAVATWLTSFEEPWEATLTYSFYLPEKHHEPFFQNLQNTEQPATHGFDVLESFLSDYKSVVYGGEPTSQKRAEPEFLSMFDCRYIGALRDAESELLSGQNPLLRSMLEQQMVPEDNIPDVLSEVRKLLESLKDQIDTSNLFNLVTETGAADAGDPNLKPSPTERDLLEALKLYVSGHFDLPLDKNGLGYNNLIYIALVLANMRDSPAQRTGASQPAFPILVLEEPEAHLHPALQHKLLQYVEKEADDAERDTAQVFFTTHSTHVTAGSSLKNIICLTEPSDDTESPQVGYPGQAYNDQVEADSNYVERHLDATKSAMLFAKRIILVEGVTEQILLPALASLHLEDQSLADHHVEIVAVGGKTFKHFLPPFAGSDGINRPVACLVDRDPSIRSGEDVHFRSCFPFELSGTDAQNTKNPAEFVTNLRDQISDPDGSKISIFPADHMTLEYDLSYSNPGHPAICLTASSSHADFPEHGGHTGWKEFIEDKADRNLVEYIEQIDDTSYEGHVFATAVHFALKNGSAGKGIFSQDLQKNLESADAPFQIPDYITRAIDHVLPDS